MWEYKIPEKEYYDDYRIYEILYDENPVRVFVDDKYTPDWYPMFARNPYYQMRGRKITTQQALDIISKTDLFFNQLFFSLRGKKIISPKIHRAIKDKYIGSSILDNRWMDLNCGWVRPNGIIGINDITYKYPMIEEMAEDLLFLIHEFPYLDFVMGITYWDGLPPTTDYYIDRYSRHYVEKYKIYDTFCDNLEVGIWVHNKTVEFVNPHRAAELYKKYEALYEEDDKRIYVPGYYPEFEPHIITKDYLKRCLEETYGIENPDVLFENSNSKEIRDIK